jgi:hypothetical protein
MTPQVDGAMKSAGKPKGEGPKHKRLEAGPESLTPTSLIVPL